MRVRVVIFTMLASVASVANADDAVAEPNASQAAQPATDADTEDASISDVFATLARGASRDPDGFILTFEVGGSVLTPIVERDERSLAIAYGARFGYRIRDWSVLFVAEHAMWRAPELGGSALQHVANLGFGVERYYVSGFLRTLLAVGASVLLRSNDLDAKGNTGLFVDLRPIGIHWRLSDRASLLVDFLHLVFVAPVLTGVPLADVQFRSTVGMEVRL